MRHLNKKSGTTFYCFSPGVMLTTFIIEWLLAIYVFIRSTKSPIRTVSVALLLALALFQYAEYLICDTVSPALWARIGVAAITIMPPLCLHIVSTITGNTSLLKATYAIASAGIICLIVLPTHLLLAACTGNYVMLLMPLWMDIPYIIYYFGVLLIGIYRLTQYIRASHPHTPNLQAAKGMLVGYLVFSIPPVTLNALRVITGAAVPSVMCGFALIFAFILTFWIVPRVTLHKH